MLRQLLAGTFLLICAIGLAPRQAEAQPLMLPCIASGVNCVPVSATNPLPTTGGGIAAGAAITGCTANFSLFVNTAGNLACSDTQFMLSPSGTFVNPGLAGGNNSTTGLYWPATTGAMGFASAGVNKLDYNSTVTNGFHFAARINELIGGTISIADAALGHGLQMIGQSGATAIIGTLGANEPLSLRTNSAVRIFINDTLTVFGPAAAATSAFPALLRTGTSLGVRLGDNSADASFSAGNGTFSGTFINSGITTDAAHTDATVCEDTTTHQFYSGSGTLGICLGTSGRQFKTDFEPMVAGLAEINAIPLWNYRYRIGYGDNGARVQFGPTAQDIEAIPTLKVLVRYDQDGKAINYDTGALIPISLRAIQQLEAKKADRDEVTALRHEIELLKRK